MSKHLTEEDSELNDQESGDYQRLRDELLRRCATANIETDAKKYNDGNTYTILHFSNGREKRQKAVSSIKALRRILSVDFEKYVFLGNYLAIANYSDNYIEAHITVSGLLYRQLFDLVEEGKEVSPLILEHDYQSAKVKVEIGSATDTLKTLSGWLIGNRPLSIKITKINISQHNKSLEILRKITDSLFFQIDLQYESAVSLVRDRSRRFRPPRKLISRNKNGIELQFPKIEFDKGPSSLYWYGRKASGMPLLQFLAYYQVIEYYFPTYSQEEARRRIRTILKDPTFRDDRDADIGKILSATSGRGKGFGDERSQLRATINACLDPNELREFLIEYEEREKFFSAKQKGLSDFKLPLANKDVDLRTLVADLIYDIRCKIVHTKGETSDGEVELLLPFSKEAELLLFDVELMLYIARKVLIAASAPLSL